VKGYKVGYKQERACVLAYRVGPRGGIKEFLGGFIDMEDFNDYFKNYTDYEMYGELTK